MKRTIGRIASFVRYISPYHLVLYYQSFPNTIIIITTNNLAHAYCLIHNHNHNQTNNNTIASAQSKVHDLYQPILQTTHPQTNNSKTLNNGIRSRNINNSLLLRRRGLQTRPHHPPKIRQRLPRSPPHRPRPNLPQTPRRAATLPLPPENGPHRKSVCTVHGCVL